MNENIVMCNNKLDPSQAWGIYRKIISQLCWIGKDFDRNGDRLSKNYEKLPYLH